MERLGDRHKPGVCHAGQCRKDAAKEPITILLEEVSSLVKAWSGSEEAIAAACLRDSMEGCSPTSHEDLVEEFEKRPAGFFAERTDDKSLMTPMQKERQIEKAAKKTPEAALVKLADKTSSVAAIAKSPPKGLVTSTAVAVYRLGRNVVMTLPDLPQKGLNEFKRVM